MLRYSRVKVPCVFNQTLVNNDEILRSVLMASSILSTAGKERWVPQDSLCDEKKDECRRESFIHGFDKNYFETIVKKFVNRIVEVGGAQEKKIGDATEKEKSIENCVQSFIDSFMRDLIASNEFEHDKVVVRCREVIDDDNNNNNDDYDDENENNNNDDDDISDRKGANDKIRANVIDLASERRRSRRTVGKSMNSALLAKRLTDIRDTLVGTNNAKNPLSACFWSESCLVVGVVNPTVDNEPASSVIDLYFDVDSVFHLIDSYVGDRSKVLKQELQNFVELSNVVTTYADIVDSVSSSSPSFLESSDTLDRVYAKFGKCASYEPRKNSDHLIVSMNLLPNLLCWKKPSKWKRRKRFEFKRVDRNVGVLTRSNVRNSAFNNCNQEYKAEEERLNFRPTWQEVTGANFCNCNAQTFQLVAVDPKELTGERRFINERMLSTFILRLVMSRRSYNIPDFFYWMINVMVNAFRGMINKELHVKLVSNSVTKMLDNLRPCASHESFRKRSMVDDDDSERVFKSCKIDERLLSSKETFLNNFSIVRHEGSPLKSGNGKIERSEEILTENKEEDPATSTTTTTTTMVTAATTTTTMDNVVIMARVDDCHHRSRRFRFEKKKSVDESLGESWKEVSLKNVSALSSSLLSSSSSSSPSSSIFTDTTKIPVFVVDDESNVIDIDSMERSDTDKILTNEKFNVVDDEDHLHRIETMNGTMSILGVKERNIEESSKEDEILNFITEIESVNDNLNAGDDYASCIQNLLVYLNDGHENNRSLSVDNPNDCLDEEFKDIVPYRSPVPMFSFDSNMFD